MKGQDGAGGGINNRSMPPGTMIPELGYEDLEAAVAWLCKAFGFKERVRIGNHRAQLVLGEGAIVAVGEPVKGGPAGQPVWSGEASHAVMVRVEEVDRHYEQAKQGGVQILNPPTDYPFGERQYSAVDLGGHRWIFSQSIADVDPREWGGSIPG